MTAISTITAPDFLSFATRRDLPIRRARRRSMLAYAMGAPSPTLVIDAGDLPIFDNAADVRQAAIELVETLDQRTQSELCTNDVRKFALVGRPLKSTWDLGILFVQAEEKNGQRVYDAGVSCGHSTLAAICAASRWGRARATTLGEPVRVNLWPREDTLVTRTTGCTASQFDLGANFTLQPGMPIPNLLPLREPRTFLDGVAGSLVRCGNDYLFVNAADLGIGTREELMKDSDELFDRLCGLQAMARQAIGSKSPLSPKVCAVGVFDGQVHVRAVSVPRFHPSLALTGCMAMAASAACPHSVVNTALGNCGADISRFVVHTRLGRTAIRSTLTESAGVNVLHEVTVPKKVVFLGEKTALKAFKICSESGACGA